MGCVIGNAELAVDRDIAGSVTIPRQMPLDKGESEDYLPLHPKGWL
jgi:hypothetical protein